MNALNFPRRYLLLLIAASAILLGAASERADAFSTCSISSVSGATLSGTTLTMNDASIASVTFSCPGANSAPALTGSMGGFLTIGPPTQTAVDSWSFTLTTAPRSGGSVSLTFTEPGGATQPIQVVVNIVSPPADPIPGPSTPTRNGDCTSLGEPGPGNKTYQLPVEVRKPGESSFSAVSAEAMCATVTLRAGDGQVGMHVYPGPAVDYKWYPKGTVYRFTGSVPGFQPDMAGGGLKGLKLTSTGEQFTIEAEPIEHLFTLDQSRLCVGPSPSPPTYFAGNMASNSNGMPIAFRGMTVGSNGTSARSPYKTANGIAWGAEGCGDADPATKEGFYDAYIPPAILETFGITQDQLNAAGAVGDLFNLQDNGAEASGATFSKETYQDGRVGIRIYYPLSFSSSKDGAARARIAQAGTQPSSHVIELSPRGGIPAAKPSPPGRPSVKWKASKKKRTVTATVKLAAGSNVTHSLTARKLRAKKSKAGKCKLDKKKTRAVCSIKLSKGRWSVSVTPRQGTLAGTASTRNFRF